MLEKSTIFLHRLKILYVDQEAQAMKFAHIAMSFYEKRVMKNRIPPFCLEEDFNEISDIYYSLLLVFDQHQLFEKKVCLLGIILFNYK